VATTRNHASAGGIAGYFLAVALASGSEYSPSSWCSPATPGTPEPFERTERGHGGLLSAADKALANSLRACYSLPMSSSTIQFVLAVAVARLDDVAEDEWVKNKSHKKVDHLAEQFDRARALIRSQLRQELERVWESGDERVRSAQRSVIQQLCDDLIVFPLSAPQYRRLLANYAEDMPFIRDVEQSGIPARGLVRPQLRRGLHREQRQNVPQLFTHRRRADAAWAHRGRGRAAK